jgi:hypothetical protein
MESVFYVLILGRMESVFYVLILGPDMDLMYYEFYVQILYIDSVS